MLRIVILSASTVAAFALRPAPLPPLIAPESAVRTVDVRALLNAAQGTSAIICRLAADQLGNGWNNRYGAPVRPFADSAAAWDWGRDRTPFSASDVSLLTEGLANPDRCVREVAVRLLGQDDSPAVIAGLLHQAAASDASVREVATYGLGLVDSPEAFDILLKGTRDDAVGVRANSAWALGRLEDGRALQALVRVLDDHADIVREASAGALGRLDSTAAVAALMRHLRDDASPAVRRTSAWALGQLEAKEAAPALTDALRSDKDADVREMAAWAMHETGSTSGVAALLAAARSDASARVRETSVWAAAELGDHSTAGPLGEMIASERDARVRGTLAWALGTLDVKSAPRGLIAALADSDDDVRTKAAWALSEIGDANALPALREAMKRPASSRTRKAELRALLHSHEDPDRLTGLLESTDPVVREAVARALGGRGSIDPWPWPMPRPRPFP